MERTIINAATGAELLSPKFINFIGSQRQTTSKFFNFNKLIKEKYLKKIGKDRYIITDIEKLKHYF